MRFTHIFQHAQMIGVPGTSLYKILLQQQSLVNSAPFNVFGLSNDQSTDDYYHNLVAHYTQLADQVETAIASSTALAQQQTQQDLQIVQQALQQGVSHQLPVHQFSQEFTQIQAAMPQAHSPQDFARISSSAHVILQSLNMVENLSASLIDLSQGIQLLQHADLDTPDLMMSYQNDKTALNHMTALGDLESLQVRVHAQTQQALTSMVQAIPNLVLLKIGAFAQQLQLMQSEKVATNIYQTYQTKLQRDQTLIHADMDLQDYEAFATQVDTDIRDALFDQLHAQAQNTLLQFQQDAQAWNNTHAYYDTYDGQDYPLDAGYLDQGIGSDLEAELVQASSVDDLTNTISDINNAQFDLRLLEKDYQDPTSYDQTHQTDIEALDHYQLQKGQVIVVSMVEQALRLYQDGHLVRAFQVTTGRYERPSLPGLWSVLDRESPTVFRSSDPPNSPFWYPPTPIHYAMLYHQGGYFIHDSWWRDTYGPGTQFPHPDASGNQDYAGNGSHGCINVQEDQAAWLYSNTAWSTPIVIY
jgi:lipoprotein-anchoring transpeptidase ErfK/SrfK